MSEKDAARRAAIEANRRVWTLLEKAERSDAETAEMIAAARESLIAWEIAGGPVEAQRGNWMIARAYLDAGAAVPGLDHALRTLELTDQHRALLADFDLAFAEEIAARAWAASGDLTRAAEHRERARGLGDRIVNDGDRMEFFRQFALPPWFGLDATA